MKPLRHRINLACKTVYVPTPDEVVAALKAQGQVAEITERHLPWNFEIAISPNRTRVLIDFGGDLHDDWDVVIGDLELLDDYIADGKILETERKILRRFVSVGFWNHADRSTIDCMIGSLCATMSARILSETQQ